MQKEKVMDFDFKKVLPTEGSVAEKKISAIVTQKFLMLGFTVALGFGMGYYTLDTYYENKQEESVKYLEKQRQEFLLIKENKENILLNLEAQMTMYDSIIKDILEANKQIPNSAQTILNQTDQIRGLSQTYKENIANLISNVNKLTNSEEEFLKSSSEEKKMLSKTLQHYKIGSLNRNNDLEKIFMSATSPVDYDENKAIDKATPIREELKKKVVEKMANLLGSNEITKPKKLNIK